MSFKDFSSAHSAPANDKSDDKSKPAPAIDQPPTEPQKTPLTVFQKSSVRKPIRPIKSETRAMTV